MKVFRRCPLVSIAALTAYLAVNIGAGALHHHHGATIWPEMLMTGCGTDLQIQATDPADDDDDDEETCVLCSVLHLAQTLPTAFHVEAVTALTGEASPAVAIFRPSPLETATHARAPPVV